MTVNSRCDMGTSVARRYKCQWYVIETLGIDLSRAFDTIRREKLLSVLHSFLDTDNVRIILFLLSQTNITVRVDDALSAPFNTTVGFPQGDSLSPVVNLEATLRTLRGCLPHRPPADTNLPCEAIYADDTDLISTDHEYLSKVNELHWASGSCMSMSTKQSAQTSNCNTVDWLYCRKIEDDKVETWIPARRRWGLVSPKHVCGYRFPFYMVPLAAKVTFSERLQLRLYNALVRPLLIYNAGTDGIRNRQTECLPPETTWNKHRRDGHAMAAIWSRPSFGRESAGTPGNVSLFRNGGTSRTSRPTQNQPPQDAWLRPAADRHAPKDQDWNGKVLRRIVLNRTGWRILDKPFLDRATLLPRRRKILELCIYADILPW